MTRPSATASSGVMATDSGGPATLPGTSLIVPRTLTGNALRSSTVMVSGFGSGRLLVTPFSWTILWSFDETAIWPSA